jgi:hypothetical protein
MRESALPRSCRWVREVEDAIGAVVDRARKLPLTRLAPAGESAGGEPPSPPGRGMLFGARIRAAMSPAFSAGSQIRPGGRKWTATGVLTSRRGTDEGSLPACHRSWLAMDRMR